MSYPTAIAAILDARRRVLAPQYPSGTVLAFDPSTVAGMTGVVADEDEIASILDLSGEDNHATDAGGSPAIWNADGFVTVSGDCLYELEEAIANAAAMTIGVLMRRTGGSGTKMFTAVPVDATHLPIGPIHYSDNNLYVASQTHVKSVGHDVDTLHSYIVRFSGATVELWIDGELQTLIGASATASGSIAQLFTRGADVATGLMGRFFITPRAISTNERTRANDWLWEPYARELEQGGLLDLEQGGVSELE